jgi:hypothetical protein
MQVQRVQNNNYNTTFGEKLIFDTKLITRATREEKSEMVLLKRLFRDNGNKGNIKVKNNRKLSVKDIIADLQSRLHKTQTGKQNQEL